MAEKDKDVLIEALQQENQKLWEQLQLAHEYTMWRIRNKSMTNAIWRQNKNGMYFDRVGPYSPEEPGMDQERPVDRKDIHLPAELKRKEP